jgi:uncharacterized repeat protein (TIGR01451 family)
MSNAQRIASWLIVFAMLCGAANADTSLSFSIPDKGGISFSSAGTGTVVTVGSARVQANGTTPAGVAIFGFRQNNTLISETGVPLTTAVSGGRLFALVAGPVNTGIAIANPNAQPVTVNFYFTDLTGKNFGSGSTQIPANGQIAKFLTESPFNSGPSIEGTFTFSSSLPVGVIALRGFVNERSEFLMTTLPIVSLNTTSNQPSVFAHFADGGGWSTQLVLVNPTSSTLTGTAQFVSTSGTPAVVTVNGQSNSSLAYSIPANSSVRLQTSNPPGNTQVGSVVVTPASGSIGPSGLVIFSFNNGTYTVSEAGVQASTLSKSFRLSAEASDIGLSVMTGIAVANPSSSPINVRFDLTTSQGGSTGLSGLLNVPANGQVAKFLNQIPGLDFLPDPFVGIVRISTDATTGFAVTGLRGRTNERGDFLITTSPAVDENAPVSSGDAIFPQIADGAGYSTQFVLFSAGNQQTPAGALRFFDQTGQPLDLNFGAAADLAVTQTGPLSCNVATNQCNGLTFQITVTNNGPGVAQNVQFNNVLPIDPTTGNPVATVNQITATGSSCVQTNRAISCQLGDLPNGAVRTFTVVENLLSSAQGRTVRNSVWASSDTLDLTLANNIANLDLNVLPQVQADLQIGPLTAFPNPVSVGNSLFFPIGIINQGPSAATGVRLTSTISGSAKLTFLQAGSTPGCSQTAPAVISCDLGTIPANDSRSIRLVFQPTAAGTATNTSTVVADEPDPVPANGTQTVSVTVNP